MKFIEPAFDTGGDLWRPPLNVPDSDAHALNEKFARQSAELRLRLTEVLELHNVQQRQANELQDRYDDIDRLSQTVSALQEAVNQYKMGTAAAEDKIILLESEKRSCKRNSTSPLRNQKRWLTGCMQQRRRPTEGKQQSHCLLSR